MWLFIFIDANRRSNVATDEISLHSTPPAGVNERYREVSPTVSAFVHSNQNHCDKEKFTRMSVFTDIGSFPSREGE